VRFHDGIVAFKPCLFLPVGARRLREAFSQTCSKHYRNTIKTFLMDLLPPLHRFYLLLDFALNIHFVPSNFPIQCGLLTAQGTYARTPQSGQSLFHLHQAILRGGFLELPGLFQMNYVMLGDKSMAVLYSMIERKPQTRLLYKEKIFHGNATCDTD
jgi:hypothetical protein